MIDAPIDAPAIQVWRVERCRTHQVFAGPAAPGKTVLGWLFGFKLHVVVNDHGELLNVMLTPGNVDDRRPVPRLARLLFGMGDRSYLSQKLVEDLCPTLNVQPVTQLRAKMKNRLLPLMDKL